MIIFMHTLIVRTRHFLKSDKSAISAELSCETPACTVDARNVEINFYTAQTPKAESVSRMRGVYVWGWGSALSPPFLFYLPQCLDIFLLAVLIGAKRCKVLRHVSASGCKLHQCLRRGREHVTTGLCGRMWSILSQVDVKYITYDALCLSVCVCVCVCVCMCV